MHPLRRVRRPPALGRPRARCAAASGCAAPPRGGRPSGRGRPRLRVGSTPWALGVLRGKTGLGMARAYADRSRAARGRRSERVRGPDRGAARRDRLTPVRDVVILGSTGSIGTQALEVIADRPEEFRVVGARRRGARSSCSPGRRWRPTGRPVAVATRHRRQDLQLAFYAEASRRGWSQRRGPAAADRRRPGRRGRAGALPCDVVLNGITGSAGLRHPGRAAAGSCSRWRTRSPWSIGGRWSPAPRAGPDRRGGLRALGARPVSARRTRARSTGWSSPRAADRSVAGPGSSCATSPPPQALAHPTWDMGRVITTNSATLVNKGLELLEAHLLYGVTWIGSTSSSTRSRSCTRWCSSSTARPSPSARRRTCGCRSRSGWAGPTGCPGAPGLRLDDGRDVDLRAAGRRGVPGRRAGPAGGPARRQRAGRLQRGQRGVRRRLPRGPSASSTSSTSSRRCWPSTGRAEGRAGADVGSMLVVRRRPHHGVVLAADAWARERAARR